MTDPREPLESEPTSEELLEATADDAPIETPPAPGDATPDARHEDKGIAAASGASGVADADIDTTAEASPAVVPAAPAPAKGSAAKSKPGTTAGGTPASGAGDAEHPYVDDPVSKWWVGVIVAVFAVILVWAVFLGDVFDGIFEGSEGTPAPIASPIASPLTSLTTEASPDATAVAVSTPIATPMSTTAPSSALAPTLAPSPVGSPSPSASAAASLAS